MISQDQEIEIVGNAYTGKEAIELASLTQPHVILMDIEMESKTAGIDAAMEILESFPRTKIIVLTVYEKDEFVFSAFQNGVVDYMLKDACYTEIIKAIKDAHYDRSPIRPKIAKKIRNEFQRIKTTEESFLHYVEIVSKLTESELNILYLLLNGHSRNTICEIRHVELSTLKSQINSILKKFDKNSTKEIIHLIKKLKLDEMLSKMDFK
jgi:DNA-binding NarL/FixJ family response regulator